LLATLALGALLAAAAPAPTVLVFDRFNRHYQDLDPEVQRFRQGPLEVAVDVDRASVAVERHSAELRPLADGTHRVRGEVLFSGLAHLTADVGAGGMGGQLADRVVVPSQEKIWEGVVRVRARPAGYDVTVVKGPRVMRVEVESRLADQATALCRAAALWPGSGLACDGLAAFFSNAPVLMPSPGETFFIERSELSPAEQAQVDAYLAADL
jgi:hypothetical protein